MRPHQAWVSEQGSRGLGLAFIGRCVMAHHGAVRLFNARPGAVVEVQLPLLDARGRTTIATQGPTGAD